MEYLFPIIIFIFSVIIHEVCHGLAAYMQGDNTAKMQGRLTLNPIPHVDLFGSILLPGLLLFSGSPMVIGWAKPVPFNPFNLRNQRWGEAIVAAAGPLSNICIAIIFGFFMRFGLLESLHGPFMYIVFINLVLAIFNLVPIPPLDGSKILFSVFPNSLMGLRESLERTGFILLIVFVFFLWSYVFPVVSFFFTLITGFSF